MNHNIMAYMSHAHFIGDGKVNICAPRSVIWMCVREAVFLSDCSEDLIVVEMARGTSCACRSAGGKGWRWDVGDTRRTRARWNRRPWCLNRKVRMVVFLFDE